MLAFTALLSLATFVFADETFTLTAQGENINSKVGIADSKLVLNNEAATFILQTPSGYLTANGKDVVLTPQGIEVSDSSRSKDFGVEDGKLRSGPSSDKFDFYSCPDGTLANFRCQGGVAISLLTGDAAQTSTETSASSQPSSSHTMLLSSDVTTSIQTSSSHTMLLSSDSTVTISSSSSEHPMLLSSDATTTIPSSSSEHSSIWTSDPTSTVTKPPFGGNSTITNTHSTLETVTSCSDNDCHRSASVTSHENGAAQAKYAAGAIAFAAALLL